MSDGEYVMLMKLFMLLFMFMAKLAFVLLFSTGVKFVLSEGGIGLAIFRNNGECECCSLGCS